MADTSKYVQFKCPTCNQVQLTGAPIGTGLNVRVCGSCSHFYHIMKPVGLLVWIVSKRPQRIKFVASEGSEPNFNFTEKRQHTFDAVMEHIRQQVSRKT